MSQQVWSDVRVYASGKGDTVQRAIQSMARHWSARLIGEDKCNPVSVIVGEASRPILAGSQRLLCLPSTLRSHDGHDGSAKLERAP